MAKKTDIRPSGTELYFLPVQTRVPLKFGTGTVTSVTCARARMTVTARQGKSASGWGETPLSVQWVWPSDVSFHEREDALKRFCVRLAKAWSEFDCEGHPIEIGQEFQERVLPGLLGAFNREERAGGEPMPWLAALVCCSVFDQALHDAFGQVHQRHVYEMYGPEFLNRDLSGFLVPADGANVSFKGKYPTDFLVPHRSDQLPAWHLVGGLDLLEASALTGNEPRDGYPVLLRDWIDRDGLKCLKVKLRGNDERWDYERLVNVGQIALEKHAEWLSADFNCTVSNPAYVNAVLDRLHREHSRIHDLILYVEQPFPYELNEHRIDVRSVAARKPLFLDESAHDWRMVRLGRELGWTGVALKTCKTQSGALLSACWAKAHGMALMVQDLTNPMLAQIPHVLLATHVGTIMGVETNAMQFYPDASECEETVHPGLYRRQKGIVDLSTVRGPGFGYRLAEIKRELPEPVATFGK